MDLLRRLGARIRARRLHVGRTAAMVAANAEISINQLSLYETGQGHPPACTLHRIALTLGTSSSALLGEAPEDNGEQFDVLVALYSDPMIGAVTRHMQDMTIEQRKSVQVVAAAFARMARPPEKVEVMR